MNTRFVLLTCSTVMVFGCSKETATAPMPEAAPPTRVEVLAPSATGAPSASATVLAVHTPPIPTSVPATPMIPSQADEAIAAAKEIDKTSYKAELSAIEKELK